MSDSSQLGFRFGDPQELDQVDDEPPPVPTHLGEFELLPSSLANDFKKVFDCIEIAEEEIATAIASTRDSGLKERFNSAFKHLVPPATLSRLDDQVYRAHARELIARVGEGQDVRPGTAAEVLVALSETSQVAPLDRTGFLLYCRLFREVMPNAQQHHHASPDEGQDFYAGEADALLDTCRRRLSSPRGTSP